MLNVILTTYKSEHISSADARFYFEEALKKHCNLTQLGDGWEHDKNPTETIQEHLDRKNIAPDFVFSTKDTAGYKCGNIIDMHRIPYKRIKSINQLKYDVIFTAYLQCGYAYIGERRGPFKPVDPNLHYKTINAEVMWNPHSVESSIFYPSDEEPVFDVAFLGDKGLPIYPLRTVLYDGLTEFCEANKYRLLKHKRIQGKVASRNIPRIIEQNPTLHHPVLVGSVYADALRRSRCFIFGSSLFKYPIKKWFEAGASRTLILADTPIGAERLHLEEWVTHIPIDKENWRERLRWALDNPKESDKMAQTWYKRVMEYHINHARAKQFIGQLQRFKDDNG